MNNAWNCYLLAFKNIFNYKDSANRQELNWFVLFIIVFWILLFFITFGTCVTLAVTGKDTFIPMMFGAAFIIACIYLLAHIIPLISLVRRRFNNIALSKGKLFFSIWATIWFIQFLICTAMFFLVKGSMGNINPLHILPLAFIGQICGFFVIGIIIFLMIREKPIV